MNAIYNSTIKSGSRVFLIALSIVFLHGCAGTHKGLYYWGAYEPMIHDIYHKPGSADPQTQIYMLTTTMERAENKGLKVPPGLMLHLGMLYAQVGNPDYAKELLMEEKTRYPESAVFIDGILERSGLDSIDMELANIEDQQP